MQVVSLAEPRFAALETTEGWAWERAASVKPPWSELYAATSPQDAVWELAQACLEDLGAAWCQRNPSAVDESWRALYSYDARVLQQLDGVLAAGHGLFDRLQERMDELDTPSDWFAQVFVLSNIREQRAEAQLRQTLTQLAGADASVRQACVEALAASAHPELHRLVKLEATVPEAYAVVLHARALRCEVTEQQVLECLQTHEHPAVLSAAAFALQRWAPGSLQSSQALSDLLQHEDEEVLGYALTSAGIARVGAGYHRALQLCESFGPGYAKAARAAVLHAWHSTGDRLTALWNQNPSAELAEAMGRHGDPALIPFFIEQLRAGNQPEGCAAALATLTGARLLEERLVPVYEAEERAFADDPDARVAMSEPTLDPEPWCDYWETYRHSLQTISRVRFGRPYDAAMLAAQMEGGTGDFAQRGDTQLELQALSRGQAPFVWVADLFARQRRSMRQLRAWVAANGAHLRGELRHARA